MTLIEHSGTLAAACERQRGAQFITVDTEFLRESTYWPKLCVVQVAGPGEAFAIDALAPEMDLRPLLDLLADESILKVVHSGRQDIEIFSQLMEDLPRPVFDTQVAGMVCGFGDQVAYDTLVRKLTGEQIDKLSRMTDWSHRPLTDRQIAYALSDVIHLRPVYEKLRDKLEASGRAGWLAEEMAILSDPATYVTEPEDSWRRLKVRSGNRRYLGVLRSLAAWREREAQARDVPRNRVVRDEQLLDIAAQKPRDAEHLARTRGLSRDFARGVLGRGILEAVAEGLAVPESECPELPRESDKRRPSPALVDLLKVLLKLKCEESGVAQKLVANTADLEAIALDDRAKVGALSGWRHEIFGKDALALKAGRLALAIKRGKLTVFPLAEGGAARAGAVSPEAGTTTAEVQEA